MMSINKKLKYFTTLIFKDFYCAMNADSTIYYNYLLLKLLVISGFPGVASRMLFLFASSFHNINKMQFFVQKFAIRALVVR